MNPSRITGPYDDSINNLMEDMGVDAQIESGRLYYISDGKLRPEPDSVTDYITKKLGYPVSQPSTGWLSSLKRTVSTYVTGMRILDTIINHYETQKKLIMQTSRTLIANHENLTNQDSIHQRHLLTNFTEKIKESIKGLKILCDTYKSRGEERFVSRMQIIIQSLNDQIEENFNATSIAQKPVIAKNTK